MTIIFTKSYRSGRYNVTINGRPAGVVIKEKATSKTWWIYRCDDNVKGRPVLKGIERQREWAVRHAILDPLGVADDIKEYFAL